MTAALWGWAAASAAAVCYGVASVAQAVGIRSGTAVPEDAPLHRRAWVARWYPIGLALDGAGFVASVAALQVLPLFAVQATIAASVGVTALVARLALHTALSRIQLAALAVLGAALVAIGFAAPAQSARLLPSHAGWLLVVGVVVAAGIVAAAASERERRWTFPVLAGCAGLGYAGVGVAARVLIVPHPWWRAVLTTPPWAVAGYGAVGIVAFTLALARGPVTVATAWTLAIETVIPALVGVWLLGDQIRPGRTSAAIAGFVAVVVACLGLAAQTDTDSSISATGTPR